MVSPATTPPLQSARGPHAKETMELHWKGRPLAPARVAFVYLAASTLLLLLGIAFNYVLTGGQWYVGPTEANVRQYLRADPYDTASAALLALSLLGLGAGFIASYTPRLSSRWFQLFSLLAVVFLAAFLAAHTGALGGDAVLYLVLTSLFAFLALAWATAALIGPGPRMHHVRALGFALFGFYWATQMMKLFHAEEGDFVNALFAGGATYFFNYFAYHELLSAQRNEDPRALHWLAGTAFITTGVYFATHKIEPVSHWLILHVAKQTTWLLQFFGQGVVRSGGSPDGSMIYYPAPISEGSAWFPVQIILACTAIQSIMIFVGGILSLQPPRRGEGWSGRSHLFEALRPSYSTRRFFGLLFTVPLIFVLNLFRNVIIIWMSGQEHPVGFSDGSWSTRLVCQFSQESLCGPADAAFWFSHNIIGKGGSLLALIIIAFIVFEILPELYDSIIGLLDLRDRRGPLERWFRPRPRGGNGGVRRGEPTRAPTPELPTPAPAPDHLGSR